MKKHNKYYLLSLLLAMAASFVSISCAEEDIVNDLKKGPKNGVSFAVTDVQDAPDADMAAPAASKEAFMVSNIDFNEGEAADMCLQETTVPGVNPMKRTPQTRAWLKSTIDGDFGASACANGSAAPDFFYNEKVTRNGWMYQPKSWNGSASTLKFYAVYPYMDGTNANQKLVQATTGSLPYVQFKASTDIANQTDLMTAETTPIGYTNMGGAAHVIPLKFYHALTAIRFGIGSNLSWSKRIKSIEFQGVRNAGRFNLATKTWSNQTGSENFKLDNLNQPVWGTLNTVIVKDGKTFLMVPQTLPMGAKIVITFTNGTRITANIGGKIWTAGTTKTYMITEKNSDWEYIILTTSPAVIGCTQTQSSTPYGIKSYRNDPITNRFEPVGWKVVSYKESSDNGLTWGAESTTMPTWITNLSLTEGNGGTSAQGGTVTVKVGYRDFLAEYNKVLQEATPKGSAGDYYDLSMHNFKGQSTARNTANSYLISAPGYYKIPLVYGNAITNGNPNPHSYISQAPTGTPNEVFILRNFIDHDGQPIDNAWITETNGGANKPDGAKIVWSDQSGIVDLSSLSISPDGKFIQFRVPQDKIKNGNAVIAATKNGVVVWSWHLWFDHNDVLETIKYTNHQGVNYYFTKQTLGFSYRKWEGTSYKQTRVTRVKVEQTVGNGGVKKVAYFDIKQDPKKPNSVEREWTSTYYQFYRKDPFPGVKTVSDGFFSEKGGTYYGIKHGIQRPDLYFNQTPSHMTGGAFANLWSIDNLDNSFNDNPVVKSIYDPCPAGFKLPAARAFSGFTTTGETSTNVSEFNVVGDWDNGWHFKAADNKTIFFPATGLRSANLATNGGGTLEYVGLVSNYTTAIPQTVSTINGPYSCSIAPLEIVIKLDHGGGYSINAGVTVRPVAE